MRSRTDEQHLPGCQTAASAQTASRRRAAAVLAITILAAGVIAGCGSSSGSSGGGGGGGGGGGALTVAIFMPFSGPDALFGAVGDAGVIPAVKAIDAAGGVMGHQLVYKNVDTRGDPADAVPAAQQLLATTSGLVGMTGPTSDEASATVPILNRAGIPMNIGTGQSSFDKTNYAFIWRNTPPDAGDGAAMAYYAYKIKGYTRAAAVYGNDISSQGAEPASTSVFKALGGQIVATENIPLDATSYDTEVAKVIAAHPQVIFTEADPQTSATFFKELANAGGLIPFIGADGTNGQQWVSAVKKGIGAANFNRLYTIVQFGAPPSAAANLYNQALLKYPAGIQKPVNQWVNNPYGLSQWDFVNSLGLAMLEAHSVNPRDFNSYIAKVTAPSPGATVVDSFSAGKQALAAGKHIRYVGGLGPTVYDQYHNSAGTFLVQGPNQTTILHVIPGATVTQLLSQTGQ